VPEPGRRRRERNRSMISRIRMLRILTGIIAAIEILSVMNPRRTIVITIHMTSVVAPQEIVPVLRSRIRSLHVVTAVIISKVVTLPIFRSLCRSYDY
jgi:hypothetical protein